MYKLYELYLLSLHSTMRYRKLPDLYGDDAYLNFSTNDYLNLSKNPEIIKASIEATQKYGNGSTGSRLLSGNSKLHEELEAQIASDKHTESALVFNSGFQANFSTLSALLNQKILKARPIVFFDKSNHSSLYQGIFVCLLSPELIRYNHNDIKQLETLLAQYKNDDRPKFIVTETVFGMEGYIAPLGKIISLAKTHKAFLYLDEAHATGLFGKNGYGLSTLFDLNGVQHVIMGTFSKALGSVGGYVACNSIIKEYLINAAPGFIYSTSLPPAIIAAVLKSWNMIRNLDFKRNKLEYLGKLLRDRLLKEGFDIGSSTTNIVPIILKQEDLVINVQKKLFDNKIKVSAIRPPTVPGNSSRIRIALTSEHQEQDIDVFMQALKMVL